MEDEKNSKLLEIEQFSSQAMMLTWDCSPWSPRDLIRKYQFFPVKKKGNKLYVAIADVFNVMALDDLRLLTGFDIYPLQTTEKEIEHIYRTALRHA